MIPWYTAAALVVGLIALFVATKNYRRKSGILIRGSYTSTSSISCEDHYVSSIVLENLKDRAVTIFAIYLRIGPNNYIELETFDEFPLILKAFETYQKEYGPVEFYEFNGRKLAFNELLKANDVKKRIILSTGDGRYVVPAFLKRWDPVFDYFRNHMTVIVRPIRTKYKGESVGGNVRFVVELTSQEGKEHTVLLHPSDYNVWRFSNFVLTKEALESKEKLEDFLNEQRESGKLVCTKFVIHDMEKWRSEKDQFSKGSKIELPQVSAFSYYFWGRLFTWRNTERLKIQNRKTAALNSKATTDK